MDWMFAGLLHFIAAIWVIFSVRNSNSDNKLIWIICAVLFSVVTAIVYFFAGPKRIKA